MEEQLEKISAQQKETWNKFSPGWKRWDNLSMEFLKPIGDEMIYLLKPKGNDLILDIAAGTGELGLTIATMLSGGKVIVTDLAEGMLEVAKENAMKRGIKNVETKVCDVSQLPFDDNTFDAISCRLGFMFFPDMLLAAKEMRRVLKPGGRITTAVWGAPEGNFWITVTMNAVSRNIDVEPPPPGAPGIFRCAKNGLIAGLFHESGFKHISEKVVHGKLNAGTADVYWNLMTDVVAPVVAAMAKADEATKLKIKNDVFQSLKQKYQGNNIAIDSNALVIYAEK